jgi:hypothetical protein
MNEDQHEETIEIVVDPAPETEAEMPKEPTYLWALLFNGTPISSLEELLKIGSSASPEGKVDDELALQVWEARKSFNPESRISPLIKLDPVFIAGVEYVNMVQSDGLDLALIGQSGKSIPEIIVKATAGILLKDGLSDHFVYLEDGELVVNPENPPTLDQGNELLGRILQVKETGEKIGNYAAWTLGMISDMLENHFGENFDATVVMGATGATYNNYITSLTVFREYWMRRRLSLSYTHHKEVHYSSLDDDQKEFVLDVSEKLRLPISAQRKLMSFIRIYGVEGNGIEESDNIADLLDRIAVRSTNRQFLFFMPNENQWRRYKGPFDAIPPIARHIINLDTRTIITNGNPIAIDEWTPEVRPTPPARETATIEAEVVSTQEL